jgi:hypothetical protein
VTALTEISNCAVVTTAAALDENPPFEGATVILVTLIIQVTRLTNCLGLTVVAVAAIAVVGARMSPVGTGLGVW